MGVDEARQYNASAQIQFPRAARFRKPGDLAPRSGRDNIAVAHEYGAVAHKTGISRRRAAPGDVATKRKEFFAARDQEGLGHDAAIMDQKRM